MTTEDARAEKIKLKAAQRPTPTTTTTTTPTTTTPTSDLSSRYEKKKSDTAEYYKTQQDLLKKNYDISVSELDAQKKQASEQAAISHELLKKYLPTTMRATGVANTGTADSLSLQALSNYQNNLADIDIGYNSDKSSLDKAYNSNVSDLESRRRTEENTLLSEYEAKVEAASANAYDEVAKYIEEATTEMLGEDGKISQADYDKLQNYIDNTPDLTDTDRAGLDNMLKQYESKVRSEADQKTIDDATAESNTIKSSINNLNTVTMTDTEAKLDSGENFSVKFGDKTYKLQVGTTVSDPTLINAFNSNYATNTPNVGASLVYNGAVYMYIKDSDENARWVSLDNLWRQKEDTEKKTSYNSLVSDITSPKISNEALQRIGGAMKEIITDEFSKAFGKG